MEVGKLGVWYFFDTMSSEDAAETAKKIESLGYSTLWIPETTGKNPLVLSSWLLANTDKLNFSLLGMFILIVATGLNGFG